MIQVGDIVEIVDGIYTITKIGTRWRVYEITDAGTRVRLGNVIGGDDFETVRRRLFSGRPFSGGISGEWKKHYEISLYRIPIEHVKPVNRRNIDHKSLLADSMEEVEPGPDPGRVYSLGGVRNVQLTMSNLSTIA